MAVREVPVHFECAVILGQWELLEELKGSGFCFISKEISAGTVLTPAHKINTTLVVEASLCLMPVIQAAQRKLGVLIFVVLPVWMGFPPLCSVGSVLA